MIEYVLVNVLFRRQLPFYSNAFFHILNKKKEF